MDIKEQKAKEYVQHEMFKRIVNMVRDEKSYFTSQELKEAYEAGYDAGRSDCKNEILNEKLNEEVRQFAAKKQKEASDIIKRIFFNK